MDKQDSRQQDHASQAKKPYTAPAVEAVPMETAVRGLFGRSADTSNNTKSV